MPSYEDIVLGDRDRLVVQLRHHGAHDGVTGSCHQLLLDGRKSLLVDCGLFQGAETAEAGGDDDNRHRVIFGPCRSGQFGPLRHPDAPSARGHPPGARRA